MKKIVIIAGDHSGDIYGGLLAQKLKEKYPSAEIYSFGGEHLARHSRQVIDLISHAVMGLVEVLSSLGKLIALFNSTVAEIDRIQPDLIIPIDSPDFNLRLVKKLNKRYPVFYYVSPQVWAWRKSRIKQIKKYVNRMVVLFKFEQDFYKNYGIETLYFGHPLLEIIKPSQTPVKNIISFLPGSRRSVLKRHLPLIKKIKILLEQDLPGYQFRVVRPHNIPESFYQSYIPGIPLVTRSPAILEESKFIISASGTATMELAILNVPYLIIYKVNFLTWFLIKKLVAVKFAGIVNIICGKKVVEEFLQDAATPQKIAAYTLKILSDENQYNALKKDLAGACELLKPVDATARFAAYIGNYLGWNT